jgi:EAL domain-containing protein (putative c-di-GMP-specific phosphodiesterase class I)/GGDEF domain-containing protein
MNIAISSPVGTSSYADCLEAIRSRIVARESKLYDVAILVVYVHQLERLYANVGQLNAGRMLDELRNRLALVLRPGDYFTRLSDRKFAFVLSNLRNQGHAILAANKILRAGTEPLTAGGQQSTVRLSVGIGMYPAHGRTPEALMQCSEIALLEAWKTSQPFTVYTARKTDEPIAGGDLDAQLASALEHGELILNYQPKIAYPDMRIVGAEALMRWNRPDAGNVPPEIFIDIAEMTGQIDPLTQFAFHRALRQLGEWPKSLGRISVAVNVTPSLVCNPGLVDMIQASATRWSVDLSRLTVEVTENALLIDRQRSHRVLSDLRELGVRISIDDYGTGYSSLSYLKEIPADELKIDKSFVMNMLAHKADRKIVEQSIALGHSFDLTVVAEGVEDERIAQQLIAMGCDFAQGFHYARPLAPDKFVEWVHGWRPGERHPD